LNHGDGDFFCDVFGVLIFPGAMSNQAGSQMNYFGASIFEFLGVSYYFIRLAAAAAAAGIKTDQVNGVVVRESSSFVPH
jgi:hypothetical protein